MNAAGQTKVAIDVRSSPIISGGSAVFISALISGLGKLTDGPETYVLAVRTKAQVDWLEPFMGPNQQFVIKTDPLKRAGTQSAIGKGRLTFPGLFKRARRPLILAARHHLQELLSPPGHWREVRSLSDGFYEGLGCDVVHFPSQGFVLCALPTIYNPHDLQHLHFPQFYLPETIAERDTVYSAGCHFAHTIAVGSLWAKEDIVRQYRISPEKIQVIPESAPTQLYAQPSQEFLEAIKAKYQFNLPFALYPAQTWAHKNHIRLLDAIAQLRDSRGLKVQLVCTGSPYEQFWPHVKRRVDELNLHSQVKFLGFIPDEELRAVYHLSQFLVEPSLFEASSLPIFEAWSEGVPVACSDCTALPEQALDAALLFDPASIESIASAMEKISTDSDLRQELRENGFRRLKDFDWERTAKAYRAVYRRAAGRVLTEEDRWLLNWNWMKEPRRKTETPL